MMALPPGGRALRAIGFDDAPFDRGSAEPVGVAGVVCAGFVFQVAGLAPDATGQALARLTDRGHVPEPLRLAHLVGSAVVDGESRGRA